MLDHAFTLLLLPCRLGANFHQIPVNKPLCPVMHPTMRDGPYCHSDNGAGMPNYWPNSFSSTKTDERYKTHCQQFSGDVQRFDTANDDNFEQVSLLLYCLFTGQS